MKLLYKSWDLGSKFPLFVTEGRKKEVEQWLKNIAGRDYLSENTYNYALEIIEKFWT
jgi:uncharacterized membrane protein